MKRCWKLRQLLKRNPGKRKSVKLLGCVGLISDHRNGNIPTLCRRASLCHENIQHHRHLRHLRAVSKSTPTENDVKTLRLSKVYEAPSTIYGASFFYAVCKILVSYRCRDRTDVTLMIINFDSL